MSKEELPMIIPEKKMAIKRQKQRNIEGIKRVGKIAGNFGLAAIGVGGTWIRWTNSCCWSECLCISRNKCNKEYNI